MGYLWVIVWLLDLLVLGIVVFVVSFDRVFYDDWVIVVEVVVELFCVGWVEVDVVVGDVVFVLICYWLWCVVYEVVVVVDLDGVGDG